MQTRQKAFLHALEHSGLPTDPQLVRNGDYITECMEKHLPELLEDGVTALICCHDQMANAVILQCQQLGYRVPKDISIIGFDDLPFSAYTAPPLTTIRQDRIHIGKSAYYALFSLINQVPIGALLLHAQLIVRNSCGKAHSLSGPQAE
jgi:LacI family transcriptional regulator